MARFVNLEPILAKEISKDIEELIDEGFANKTDPKGNPWPMTKGTKREPSHEFDPNDSIRRSIKVTVDGNTIDITSDKPYAIFHQEGTEFLPQRKMYVDKYLGGKWAKKIADTIEDTLDKNIAMILEGENFK